MLCPDIFHALNITVLYTSSYFYMYFFVLHITNFSFKLLMVDDSGMYTIILYSSLSFLFSDQTDFIELWPDNLQSVLSARSTNEDSRCLLLNF